MSAIEHRTLARPTFVRPKAGPARFLACAGLLIGACWLVGAPEARASTSQWSMFEDHPTLVRSGPIVREQTLQTITGLGADTLRIEIKWAEVAPSPGARKKPKFNATDPAAYPGFQPYDDLILRATSRGLRVLLTLAPDAPRWATTGGRGRNYKIKAGEFASFARAAGRRYSGIFGGLPAIRYWSIWNEPNHVFFISPRSSAPGVYRAMVARGVPALRATAAPGAQVFVGELAPVGTATKVIGPKRFMQQWLCLNKSWRRVRSGGCRSFKKVVANGFAHHPYGPTTTVPARAGHHQHAGHPAARIGARQGRSRGADLARAADLQHRVRVPEQSSGSVRQHFTQAPGGAPEPDGGVLVPVLAAEELLAVPARRRSGAIGLVGPSLGRASRPVCASRAASRSRRSTRTSSRSSSSGSGGGVRIWGHARPGTGRQLVQLQRRSGGAFVNDGGRFSTNSAGYFEVRRGKRAQYRFEAFHSSSTAVSIGFSRAAAPR